MKTNKKPDTSLYLPREHFDSLITALDYFIASETVVGENVQTQQAARLKSKILTHAYAVGSGRDARASIYLYGVEPALIIKLLAFYINRGEDEAPTNYFSQLKKRGNLSA